MSRAKAKTRESADLLVVNAEELLTLAGGQEPRTGKQMRDLGIIRDGALAVRERPESLLSGKLVKSQGPSAARL